MTLETRAILRAPNTVISRPPPPNDGNCRLNISAIRGPRAREALPHTIDVGVFKVQ